MKYGTEPLEAPSPITIDGAASEFVTDENGQVTVSFAEAGSYLLSAVSDDYILVPAICKVTADKAAAAEEPTPAPAPAPAPAPEIAAIIAAKTKT